MKKTIKIVITGSVPALSFNNFIKENADKLGVRGFIRMLEDKRIEIFIEGNLDEIAQMSSICKKGSKHSLIRNVEEKEEKYQGFTEFKILNF
jgi:acylphosphatase